MAVACTWVPLIQQFDGIFQHIQQALAYSVPPVDAILFLECFGEEGIGTQLSEHL